MPEEAYTNFSLSLIEQFKYTVLTRKKLFLVTARFTDDRCVPLQDFQSKTTCKIIENPPYFYPIIKQQWQFPEELSHGFLQFF